MRRQWSQADYYNHNKDDSFAGNMEISRLVIHDTQDRQGVFKKFNWLNLFTEEQVNFIDLKAQLYAFAI